MMQQLQRRRPRRACLGTVVRSDVSAFSVAAYVSPACAGIPRNWANPACPHLACCCWQRLGALCAPERVTGEACTQQGGKVWDLEVEGTEGNAVM